MDCAEARTQLIELRRGRLPPALADELEGHLRTCPGCRRALDVEAALDEVLERSVPTPDLPPALRDRLASLAAAPSPARRARWARLAVPALAAGLALAFAGLLVGRRGAEAASAEALLTAELVNDHLRVLASLRPAEIDSGGVHQVKPWFEGRLDFAPVVPDPGGEVVLRGGSVGYVLDRRAAVLLYTLRLHRVTLLVVRAEGLAWPPGRDRETAARGFRVVRWRAGELGYALVADVNASDLSALAASFQAATGGGG